HQSSLNTFPTRRSSDLKFDLIPYKSESKNKGHPMGMVRSDVTVDQPLAFYDNFAQSTYANSSFSWNNTNYKQDCGYIGNCGEEEDRKSTRLNSSHVSIS